MSKKVPNRSKQATVQGKIVPSEQAGRAMSSTPKPEPGKPGGGTPEGTSSTGPRKTENGG